MGIFGSANGTELMFWGTALFGTTFFFLRVVLIIVVGFGSDIDGDGTSKKGGTLLKVRQDKHRYSCW